MIKPGEIQQKANAVGVRDQQIEKDYILSWILFGISKHEHLSKTIVFKGGTVLKKVTAVQNVFHRPKCHLIVRRLWPENPILQNQSPCIKIKWAVE